VSQRVFEVDAERVEIVGQAAGGRSVALVGEFADQLAQQPGAVVGIGGSIQCPPVLGLEADAL
jgi:hypothetical protein